MSDPKKTFMFYALILVVMSIGAVVSASAWRW
jgi:hypothetical protein